MKFFRRLFYSIKQGIANIFSHKMMSFGSIVILSACLVVLGFFAVLRYNFTDLIEQAETSNGITVFISESFSRETALSLKDTIVEIDGVVSAEFVSKEDGLENYAQQSGDPALFEGLEDDNPIRDSYIIHIESSEYMDSVAAALEAIPQIDKVNAREDIATVFINLKNVVSFVTLWIFIGLAAISLFIISNTIRLAMQLRANEISIMKYVGATNSFIRMPFVVEGAVLGITSGAIACFLQKFIYLKVLEVLAQSLPFLDFIPYESYGAVITAGFFAVSLFFGIIGSVLSIGRHMRV